MDGKLIMLGMIIGSTLGGYIPTLFGVDSLSYTSLFCAFIGGILGIWVTFKLSN